MTRIFFHVTILYLIIEAQALVALLSVYVSPMTAEKLTKLEQLGYVTASIGIALLFLKSFNAYTKNKKLTTFLIPLAFVISFEMIHGVVERLPYAINDKPGALSSGVETLMSPSIKNVGDFWFSLGDSNYISMQKARAFNNKFPVNDRVVQDIYIDAIKNINTFNLVYKRETKDLTHDYIRKMRVQTSQAIYAKEGKPVSYNSAINTIAYERYIFKASPFHWLRLEASERGLNKFNPVLSDLVNMAYSRYPKEYIFLEPKKAPLTQVDKYHVMEIILQQKTWDKWRELMPYLGPYPIGNMSFEEKFSHAITNHYITPITGDIEPIPLNRSGQSAYFNKQAERLAPFFFEQGAPLISLNRIYDKDTREKYIMNIDHGLHAELRSSFDDYRTDAITLLSKSKANWSRPIDKELNIDLVRVGAIMPIMLLLSLFMLFLNIFRGVDIKDKATMFAASAIGVAIALSPAAEAIIDILIKLSYRTPQVFLT